MKKHYHFIGIGGIGMSALAVLILKEGHSVSGSDIRSNDTVENIQKQGAVVKIGHDAQNLNSPDFVVFSSAIKKDNPEMIAAREQKIPVLKRAELLAQLMESKVGITIAGAHGKTTTTSMASTLLRGAGLDPTTAVGGISHDLSQNVCIGESDYFIAEADESDGSFLCYTPRYSIITNIDFEHVDYYQNWENILAIYKRFVQRTEKQGLVIICGDDEPLKEITARSGKRYLTYGFQDDNDLVAINVRQEGFLTVFDCVIGAELKGEIRLNVPGRHNVLNALACVGLGFELKIPFASIQKGLAGYRGVHRRFQIVGRFNDILVVDDYGHHPTEIRATIEAARSFDPQRIITVFQPHRYTRTKFLMDDFASALSLSDHLIITDIYAASEKPIEDVNVQALVDRIRDSQDTQIVYLKKSAISKYLSEIVAPGDLVITLGAGDIHSVAKEFVEQNNHS